MTNMKKTVLVSAVAVALGMGGMATAQAALVAADAMSVTGGSFGMGFFTGGGYIPVTHFGTGAADIAGQYNLPGWNINVGQNTGTGTVPPVPAASGSIGSFQFGAAQVNTYTASTSAQVGGGPFAIPGGSFNDAGGTTSFDFSAFFANWNGTDFNQGSSAATLTTSGCVAGTCNYELSWTSLIVGGPFGGNTGSWKLNGTVSAVPVPAAVWLLGSGLVGLVGVARRRKAQA